MLLDNEMVTSFADALKAPYYEHVMSSSTMPFTNVMVMAKHTEQ